MQKTYRTFFCLFFPVLLSSHAWAQPAEPVTPPATTTADPEPSAEPKTPEPEPYPESTEPSIEVPKTDCEGRTVQSIQVEGNYRVTDEDILASIALRKGAPCADEQVAKDVLTLWDLGYFEHIVVNAKISRSKATVIFYVRERPAIGKITFEGNDELEESDLEEGIDLKQGGILSISNVQEQQTKIRDLYAEKGYFLARVSHTITRMNRDEVEVKFKIVEGKEVSVRTVRFVGNREISEEDLRESLQTQRVGFWSFLSSSGNFQRAHFDDDVTRLQVVYYDKGFLNVQTGTPRIELSADRHFVDITVPIQEGPRFKIRSLEVMELGPSGREVEPLGGKRTLRNQIQLGPGDWFSRASIAKDLLEIQRLYRDKGYAKVQVEPRTQTRGTGTHPEVEVMVVITRGSKHRIERIHIAGNTKTRDSVIRREILLNEGDLYHQSNLEKSKARITALGYFERVDFSEEAGSRPHSLVLNVDVVERSTGTFQVGAGYSSFESFIFTSQVQQQNLFGQGQSLTLQLQLSGIRQLAQIQFVEPYLYDTQLSLGLEAFKTIRQFQSFNRDSTGGSITLGHPIWTDELRASVQYKAEDVDISSRTSNFFGSGAGRGFNVFQRLPLANLFRSGLTSSVRLALSWDTRDNRLFPTDGVYASASTEAADSALGSSNTFLRHRLFGRYYRPLFAGLVLKANAEWGLVTSTQPQGVPIFERFFLGGILNVRGFPLYSLGPRAGLPSVTDPNASVSQQGIVIGGNMQAFYNLEVEFPIIDAVGIRGVVFTDGGNAWNTESVLCQSPQPALGSGATDPCGVDLTQLRTSWGFGVRWISPLGPLRFEWGVPFRPRPYEQPILFEFTIGNFF